MSKIDELYQELKTNEEIIRAQQLKNIITSLPEYLERFNQILALQKQIVNLEYTSGAIQLEAKSRYESLLQELLESPVISEYLSTLEEINDLVQTISSLFNEVLNTENAE